MRSGAGVSAVGARLGRSGPLWWTVPAIVLTGALVVVPIAQVIGYSFTSRSAFSAGGWVGLDNYRVIATDPLFWSAVRNNMVLLLSVPLSIVLAAVACGALTRGVRLARLYELVTFLPFLPAVASISALFIYLLSPDGPVTTLADAVAPGDGDRAWLSDPSTAIWAILGVVTWKRVGFTLLLLVAGLSSLDRSLLEAAALDGAGWWRTYVLVGLPQLRPIVGFAAILGTIEAFAWTFGYVYILTRGGPDRATWTLEYYVYQTQFREQLVGLAAAAAFALLLVACAVGLWRVATARREGSL